MAFPLTDALKRELEIPAVIGWLVNNCLELWNDSAQDIEKHWGVSAKLAHRIGVRSVPGKFGNLLASQSCLENFGAEILLRSGLFYSVTNAKGFCDCLEWNQTCVCGIPSWRLDLDPYPHGLIIPQTNQRGWFSHLKVFPHARARSFTLRVRREIAA
jgi:hypothetical protein